jgi:hypothetical protein
MADLIQIRRDTAANWTSANTVLAQGELGAETDTSKIKIGDGSTAWSSLAYLIDAGNYLVTGDIGSTVQGYDANTTTSTNTQTLTNKTIRDTVYALSGTAFDATNGAVQTKTLAANTTFTDSLSSGDAIVLQLEAGASYTVTYPTMQWVTSGGNVAPTLTAKDVLVFWKVSTTLYGAYVGSYV